MLSHAIFERDVQDPCSAACDCADACKNTASAAPVVGVSDSPVFASRCNLPEKVTALRKIHTAPHPWENGPSQFLLVCTGGPTPISPPSPLSEQRPVRKRANSFAFIHRLSRNSSMSKMFDYADNTASRPKFSRSGSMDDGLAPSLAQLQVSPTAPLTRHNSCYAIPTHVYGLEKYVTSELDELSSGPSTATNSQSTMASVFISRATQGTLDRGLDNASESSSSSDSESSSSLSLTASVTRTHGGAKRTSVTDEDLAGDKPKNIKSRRSFIKLSLAQSFA
ncbi:Isf1p KNAG_0C05710 [Huiozyma naganishii CBS 8797]|uniref:Uncharacterized protein n=1 Tax=Huiozyma naganishii (strain ATCC MYA-139 / BCRC 22969 / CBS 8797 / KCTC 17520 / NBRC 10181 / NCYC 3082 / Yp74L-3) TaxID=1071383 RepID=J7S552_HUIN7|nr:hypothetical protein KNAG_0C05710 [Kazachstania naganishii CBS 8797]CCK69669.1 hypothetical protein KNAG_0C05710 [Kazachstania naganishii CBS 8797]